MAGLFDTPKQQNPAVPDPNATNNRINDALTRQLQSGGTNADLIAPSAGLNQAQAAGRQGTLTGIG